MLATEQVDRHVAALDLLALPPSHVTLEKGFGARREVVVGLFGGEDGAAVLGALDETLSAL